MQAYCEPFFAKAQESLDGLDMQMKPMINDSPAAAIYELTDWLNPTAIGVAIDGASESRRAISAAALLAQRSDVGLRVLSVMGQPHYVLGGLLSPLALRSTGITREKEWDRVYEDAAERVPDGVATEPLLLHCNPAEALVEVTSDLDLLVLGSRGDCGSSWRRSHSARGVEGGRPLDLRLAGMPGAEAAYPAEREAEVVLRDVAIRDETVVGQGLYFGDGPDDAEVAFAMADSVQGNSSARCC